ncbi:BrnT family toxin [Thiohalocapsa sp. ML1]
MDIDFEWDETKRQANRRKHGFDFADAVEVFYDDLS